MAPDIRPSRPGSLPHSVHHAVGRQARGLMALSGIAPGWFMRELNKRVIHH